MPRLGPVGPAGRRRHKEPLLCDLGVVVVPSDPQSFSVLFQVGDALLVPCRGQTLTAMEKTMMYKFFGKAVPDIVIALVFYIFVVSIIALMAFLISCQGIYGSLLPLLIPK